MELSKIALVQHNDTHRFLKVIEALMWGLEINVKGINIRFAETVNGGVCPFSADNPNYIIGMPDLTIEWLSDAVMAMPDKEFELIKFDLAASKTLFKMKKKR